MGGKLKEKLWRNSNFPVLFTLVILLASYSLAEYQDKATIESPTSRTSNHYAIPSSGNIDASERDSFSETIAAKSSHTVSVYRSCFFFCGVDENGTRIELRDLPHLCERQEFPSPYSQDGLKCFCSPNYFGRGCTTKRNEISMYTSGRFGINFNCLGVNDTIFGRENVEFIKNMEFIARFGRLLKHSNITLNYSLTSSPNLHTSYHETGENINNYQYIGNNFENIVVGDLNENQRDTIKQDIERYLLEDNLQKFKRYIEFCGCNIGYGGEFCSERCPSEFDNCNFPTLGYCVYSIPRSFFYCQCTNNGMGHNCGLNGPDFTTANHVVYTGVLWFIFSVILFLCILIVYLQIAKWRDSLKQVPLEVVSETWKSRIYSRLPPLGVVCSLMLTCGVVAKCLHFFFYMIQLLQSPQLFLLLNRNFFATFSTIILVICNMNMVFGWDRISQNSNKLKLNVDLGFKRLILVTILNVTVFLLWLMYFIVAFFFTYSELLQNIFFIAIAIIIPIMFLIYGRKLVVNMSKENKNFNPLDMKFMKFLIAVQVVNILIVIMLCVRSLLQILLNQGSLSRISSSLHTNALQIHSWLLTLIIYLESIVYLLFIYLLSTDLENIINRLCCCIPKKKYPSKEEQLDCGDTLQEIELEDQ